MPKVLHPDADSSVIPIDQDTNQPDTLSDEVDNNSDENPKTSLPGKKTIISPASIKAKAKLANDSRKLPQPPSDNPDWKAFASWMDLLDVENHWSHCTIYIYRLFPVIDRQLTNPTNNKYIDIVTTKFDQDYIKKIHGGGTYRLHVIDNDLSKNNTVCKVILDIPLGEVDPILDYRELDLGERKNQTYIMRLRAKGILNERNEPVSTQPAAPVNPNPIDVMRETVSIMKSLSTDQQNQVKARMGLDNENSGGLGKELGNLLMEQMKQQDPAKQVQTLVSLMQAMKEGTTKDGSNVELLMKMMEIQSKRDSEANAMMLKLYSETSQATARSIESLKEVLKPNSNSTDPFVQIEKILNIQERLGGGNNRQGKQDWVDKVVEGSERILLPLLQPILSAWALSKSGISPEQLQHLQNTSGDPNAIITPPPISTSNPTGPIPIDRQIPPGHNPELVSMLQKFGSLIVEKMREMHGWEYADALIAAYGIGIHAQIAQFGPTELFDTFMSIPQLANLAPSLGGEDRIRQWLDDFVNYIQAGERENVDGSNDNDTGTTEGYKKV